ncbi:lysylphosphatidylglycerol synthase transmembrane domain-containing protein [Uliginosibacterium sp. TH139]|uniref:lysylphosphatidylglycerol synthase transmembrane domain-containing protein n=1 Tax=Uliginosibacterium sp. TH139 TaxID=2067453 RepID=UPI000C7CDCE0|nr:lysylphosphatidylglycerol synthase transmembrane domain-containing protein [Uliginosibacterium sp. TH139]PLK49120.1 lysylphosphatidylglycerol synthetase family protein [Uliginosibacterium sp. TH139]
MTCRNGKIKFSGSVEVSRINRFLMLFVGAGALLYVASMFFLGWSEVAATLAVLGYPVLIAGALFASTAYLWRFCRWEFSLNRLGYNVPRLKHFGIYLCGLALMVTPGRVGETFRSVLLLRQGVRWQHSLVAFFVDRLTDVLGICLVGFIAAVLTSNAFAWVWGLAFASFFIGSWVATYLFLHLREGGAWAWLMRKLHRLPLNGGLLILEAWALLWRPGRVLAYSGVAMLAYGSQAFVFGWFCSVAGVAASFADCVLIFVHATLFGSATLLPGGLGATEGAIVLQLVERGVGDVAAVSLAIAIRLVTIWTGLLIGALALFFVRR